MIYVFNKPDEESLSFVYDSITKTYKSRFGWGYREDFDLRVLDPKPWSELDEEQTKIFKKTSFLLSIEPGDWIVHVSINGYGRCIAGEVASSYQFDNSDDIEDYRHYFNLNPDTIIEFDRNDDSVHPYISRRLKLQGAYWRIYDEKLFQESLNNLKNGLLINQDETKEIFYLKNGLVSIYEQVTSEIHKSHPEKKFEKLLVDLFTQIPGITSVKANGSGFGTDFGSDLIVTYEAGLKALDFTDSKTLVVQAKSYEGDHWETNAVNQLEIAIEKYKADLGMLFTAANSTEILETAITELSNKLDKPIQLIAGEDVAKFLFKFGSKILF